MHRHTGTANYPKPVSLSRFGRQGKFVYVYRPFRHRLCQQKRNKWGGKGPAGRHRFDFECGELSGKRCICMLTMNYRINYRKWSSAYSYIYSYSHSVQHACEPAASPASTASTATSVRCQRRRQKQKSYSQFSYVL